MENVVVSLTITLNDDLAQRLESQAESQRLPVDRWALMILAQAAARPQEFEAWGRVNRRRYDLIEKQYTSGLDEIEEVELERLQNAVDVLLEPWDRQMLDQLKPFEALMERLSRHAHD